MSFHERAVMLRHLSFDVSAPFSGESSKHIVKRIAGVAGQVSEAQVAIIAGELREDDGQHSVRSDVEPVHKRQAACRAVGGEGAG